MMRERGSALAATTLIVTTGMLAGCTSSRVVATQRWDDRPVQAVTPVRSTPADAAGRSEVREPVRLQFSPDHAEDRSWVVIAPRLAASGESDSRWPSSGTGRFGVGGGTVQVLDGMAVVRDRGTGASGPICVRAAGASSCSYGEGSSYAVQVDPDGTAQLLVESGVVRVTTEQPGISLPCLQAEPDATAALRAVSIGIVCGTTSSPMTIDAFSGQSWVWGPGRSLGALPTGAENSTLRTAIEYSQEATWRSWRPGWYSLLAIPVAALVCVTADIWPCQDNSSPAPPDIRARVRLGP